VLRASSAAPAEPRCAPKAKKICLRQNTGWRQQGCAVRQYLLLLRKIAFSTKNHFSTIKSTYLNLSKIMQQIPSMYIH
jgi:hypothetical protein